LFAALTAREEEVFVPSARTPIPFNWCQMLFAAMLSIIPAFPSSTDHQGREHDGDETPFIFTKLKKASITRSI